MILLRIERQNLTNRTMCRISPYNTLSSSQRKRIGRKQGKLGLGHLKQPLSLSHVTPLSTRDPMRKKNQPQYLPDIWLVFANSLESRLYSKINCPKMRPKTPPNRIQMTPRVRFAFLPKLEVSRHPVSRDRPLLLTTGVGLPHQREA